MDKIFRLWLIGVVLVVAGCGSTSSVTSGTSSGGGSSGSTFSVTSTGFTNGGTIPKTFADSACGGQDHAPPLSWSNAPSRIKSFAISVIDIDFSNTVHALVVNIPTTVTSIPQDATAADMGGATIVPNYLGVRQYNGPCPGTGATHRYRFTVFALNVASITQTDDSTKAQAAIDAATLGSATLTASYTTP